MLLDNLFSYTLKYKYIENLRIAVFQTFGQAINSIIADWTIFTEIILPLVRPEEHYAVGRISTMEEIV